MGEITREHEDFLQLISEHESLVKKVCSVYGLTADDRLDLFQEIVLQLWRSFRSFRNESKVSTWIYRVALNTAISYRRAEKRHRTPDHQLPDIPVTDDPELREQVRILYRVMLALPPLDKALILLHLEGYRYAEIAGLSGLSENSVSTRISRIKKRIGSEIENIYSK